MMTLTPVAYLTRSAEPRHGDRFSALFGSGIGGYLSRPGAATRKTPSPSGAAIQTGLTRSLGNPSVAPARLAGIDLDHFILLAPTKKCSDWIKSSNCFAWVVSSRSIRMFWDNKVDGEEERQDGGVVETACGRRKRSGVAESRRSPREDRRGNGRISDIRLAFLRRCGICGQRRKSEE